MTQTTTTPAKRVRKSRAKISDGPVKAVQAQIAHEEAARFHGDQIGIDSGYDDMRPKPRAIRDTPLNYEDDRGGSPIVWMAIAIFGLMIGCALAIILH